MNPISADSINAWSQLGIGIAALFILLIFVVGLGAFLMTATRMSIKSQETATKASTTSQEKLSVSLHELAESIVGYRVALVELGNKVDNVAHDQTEIVTIIRTLSPELAKDLTPEIKIAIAPYFRWLLLEITKVVEASKSA